VVDPLGPSAMHSRHALSRVRAHQRMRLRRLGRARRGVAAVIGTLLALLVFITLFGIFLTQFLPVWMVDNEASEANLVASQMAQIKSCEDTLALSGSGICTSPVTMQSGSVPIFASPTQATLSFAEIPQLFTNVTFNATGSLTICDPQLHATGESSLCFNDTAGQVSVSLPDRYYVPLTYTLTMGAVVSSQGGTSQNMLFQPDLEVSAPGVPTQVTLTLYMLEGTPTSLSSVGTSEVYTSFAASQNYTGTNTNVNLTFTTPEPCAWDQYLSFEFKTSGVTPLFSPATCPSGSNSHNLYLMHVLMPTISSFKLTVVYFDVEMGIGNPT
jgi:type II secretory pathway pseudopilin PulG